MKDIQAFNLRTRRTCTVVDPEIVTMKTGKKAVRGIASDDNRTRVFRILKASEIEELERSL
jgi:hypothetical protein